MTTFPVAAMPREIQARLVQDGFQAYYVGGCVRDWLRGVPCADVDIATNAGLDDITRLFPRAKVVGEAFPSRSLTASRLQLSGRTGRILIIGTRIMCGWWPRLTRTCRAGISR